MGQNAWSKFLFSLDMAGMLPQEQESLLQQAGTKLQGVGWTTKRASRQLYLVTSVPLVASQIAHCRDSCLFALVLGLDLTEISSEAAFALCGRLAEDPSFEVQLKLS